MEPGQISTLSDVQQGVVAQDECAKVLILGSNGNIEVSPALTDDERRDFELHARDKFNRGIALQVKSSRTLVQHRRAELLRIFFTVSKDRLRADRRFWYFLGHFDQRRMAFSDPVFLVPSEVLHKVAADSRHGRTRRFHFQASMDPASKDRWASYRVSPWDVGKRVLRILGASRSQTRGLSNVQQGVVAVQEFRKLLIVGSHGQLELDSPVTDDERRDAEVHRRDDFSRSLALQIKSSRSLIRHGKQDYLMVRFSVRKERVLDHPRYWYFVAYLDTVQMRFAEPVFLVPSSVFHREAAHGRTGPISHFEFQASLSPNSKDKWVPHRVSTDDVANRVLEILNDPGLKATALSVPIGLAGVPGVLWVDRPAA